MDPNQPNPNPATPIYAAKAPHQPTIWAQVNSTPATATWGICLDSTTSAGWTYPRIPIKSSSSRETLYTSTPLNKNLSQGIQAKIEGLRSTQEFPSTSDLKLEHSGPLFAHCLSHTQKIAVALGYLWDARLAPVDLMIHVLAWGSVRNTVTISNYMHILNFLFNILLSPFLTSVLLLFSTEDMSRNDT